MGELILPWVTSLLHDYIFIPINLCWFQSLAEKLLMIVIYVEAHKLFKVLT